ncbi:fimbrillin family protein [Parasphaerochaeta coccoides]|uniref:Regulator of chromosome condensation RCC1 n=1 Tax=Parasphaerochaeta coccoides (strain ATCC BAA-1237 / DSM 17374 / SPN1) TaxID=760011 RepID=F4GM31_PARC1|nr:fimbrillin family protein [Parasphaerochaeta coccoides]AEC02506.1 regulator of chromosome condensation RCC1 [Parasphaerochaeta coccoides DSM 17374]
MRKNGIVFASILLVLFVFVSCDSKVCVSHSNEVRFTSEIGRKATADCERCGQHKYYRQVKGEERRQRLSSGDSEWQANDAVGIYMLEHGTGTAATAAPERANRHYTADTAFQTSGFTPADNANTLKWDDISNPPTTHFDFIAYYPYVSPIANTTALPINVYPGSGEQDTGKADFLWGRTDNVQNNTSTVRLKLDHALSRLLVNIKPSTTVDATAINDATSGFTATVKGLNTKTAINLNDGTLDAASVIESIVMKDISADTLTATERAAGKRQFEGVLIPTAHSTALLNALDLEFVLTDGSGTDTAYTWKATSVADKDKHLIHFDAGKQHIYTMTLNASDGTVGKIEIGIEDWDTGDGGNWGAIKEYKEYHVSFDGNGATSGDVPKWIQCYAGNTVIVPGPGTLRKNGKYSFDGWDTASNGTGVRYAANSSFIMPAHDMTLHAIWRMEGGVKSVSAGQYHTMILKNDDTLWGTGSNGSGEVGTGTINLIKTPVKVMSNIAAVSAGDEHTIIMQNDGSVFATGNNTYGQLGDGTKIQRRTPVKITSMGRDATAVFSKSNHTMILKKDGTLWATGLNTYGQLGDGTKTNRSTPAKVMSAVVAVSTGNNHTMILKKDGTLWGIGNNLTGQLGDGTKTTAYTPVKVMGNVAAVSAGNNHTMILKKDGTLWATGSNAEGQLGNVGIATVTSTPVQVMRDVAAVSAGSQNTMILKNDGTLWATGLNDRGQLGDGTKTNKTTPVKVMTNVAAVSAGNNHTMILKKDGTLWGTGSNANGQLGDGTTTDRSRPVQIIF